MYLHSVQMIFCMDIYILPPMLKCPIRNAVFLKIMMLMILFLNLVYIMLLGVLLSNLMIQVIRQ